MGNIMFNNCKKSSYFNDHQNEIVYFDCGWERKIALFLDDYEIRWIRANKNKHNLYKKYIEDKLIFRYIETDGTIHHYFPDFYLPDYDIYLDPKCEEVKEIQYHKLNYIKNYNLNLIIGDVPYVQNELIRMIGFINMKNGSSVKDNKGYAFYVYSATSSQFKISNSKLKKYGLSLKNNNDLWLNGVPHAIARCSSDKSNIKHVMKTVSEKLKCPESSLKYGIIQETYINDRNISCAVAHRLHHLLEHDKVFNPTPHLVNNCAIPRKNLKFAYEDYYKVINKDMQNLDVISLDANNKSKSSTPVSNQVIQHKSKSESSQSSNLKVRPTPAEVIRLKELENESKKLDIESRKLSIAEKLV